jgi:hypothetical protein
MHTGNDEEPRQRRGYVHIPHLRQKLAWLYSLHPTVNSQYKLAAALGIPKAQQSTWVNPDSIPIKYFQNFLDIWGIPLELLVIDDLDAFVRAIHDFERERARDRGA